MEIHKKSNKIYGAPKITEILKTEGEKISERTVGKYMKELGIKSRWVKRSFVKTTINPDFSKKLCNILNRRFNPDKPNMVWVTDITYIRTRAGFVYLNCIMDLYSRKIIAWTLSKNLETDSVITTIEKAKAKRLNNTDDLLIIHTDRGCQYTSEVWIKNTKDMCRSYSDKGEPYDNACIESFHSVIKREWLNFFEIRDYDEAYMLVFEYIEAFYNTVRIHSHCGYMSPNDYENLYYATNLLAKQAV